MRAVIQRVTSSSVSVDGEIKGEISKGFNVLLGVMQGDTEAHAELLAGKIARLRVFEDAITFKIALMVVQYQKLRTVSADLSSAVSENLSLQADLSDLEGENKSNSKKLNDANEKLQSENAALREENASYAAAQSELEDAKSELSSENEDLSSQVAALEDQMDAGALLDEDAWNAVAEFQRYSSNDTHRAHVIPGKNILILKAGSSTSVTLYHNYEGTVGFHLSYNHDVATAEMQEGDAGTYRLTVEGVAHGTTTLTMTNDTDDEVVSILIVVV